MIDGLKLTFSGEELRTLLDDRIATCARTRSSELLPSKPGWMEQDEYEERTAVGFHLGRLTKHGPEVIRIQRTDESE